MKPPKYSQSLYAVIAYSIVIILQYFGILHKVFYGTARNLLHKEAMQNKVSKPECIYSFDTIMQPICADF